MPLAKLQLPLTMQVGSGRESRWSHCLPLLLQDEALVLGAATAVCEWEPKYGSGAKY
jgi:hypothetical protein